MNDLINKRIIGFGVIIMREKNVLLGYQTRSYENPCWAFPGGKLDEQETIEQAVARETLEECWLKVDNFEYITFFEDLINGTHVISLVVKVNCVEGEPEVLEPNKCEKWERFNINNIPKNRTENLDRLIHSKHWKDLIKE